MSAAVRELLLLRHAQALPGASSGLDVDRPLSESGRRQAAGVAQALHSFAPQLVLCSASARTRETLGCLQAAGFGGDCEPLFSEALYECSVRQILFELATLEPHLKRVLLIGHNPGLSELASMMCRRPVGLMPADYAWMRFDGDWASADVPTAKLLN